MKVSAQTSTRSTWSGRIPKRTASGTGFGVSQVAETQVPPIVAVVVPLRVVVVTTEPNSGRGVPIRNRSLSSCVRGYKSARASPRNTRQSMRNAIGRAEP